MYEYCHRARSPTATAGVHRTNAAIAIVRLVADLRFGVHRILIVDQFTLLLIVRQCESINLLECFSAAPAFRWMRAMHYPAGAGICIIRPHLAVVQGSGPVRDCQSQTDAARRLVARAIHAKKRID